jgi:pimeloyl-ACP methyl ester carboxylesterase
VLLLHGFPETSYSWRHQMSSLAGAGFRVIAPDMRGYGASDAPESSEEYTSLHIVGDIIGLLDTFNLKEVRIILYAYSWKLIDSDSCLSLLNLETSRNRFRHHS